MQTYRFIGPDGKRYAFEAPSGLTDAHLDLIKQGLFAPARAPAEEPPPPQGEPGIWSSIMRGGRGVASLFGDVAPAMVAKGLGFEDYARRQLEEFSEYEKQTQRLYPAAVPSFTDIKDVGSALTYVKEAIFESIPSILPMIFTGGTAGILSKGAQLAAREAAERTAISVATKEITEKAGQAALTAEALETVKKTALEAGLKAAQREALKYEAAGAFVGSAALNIPEVYQNLYEKGGGGLPDLAPALVAGSFNAVLDSIVPLNLLRTARAQGITNDALIGAWYKRAGKGAVQGFLTEGATEAVQEMSSAAAERFVNENNAFFTPENFVRFIDAGLKGGFGGAGITAATNVAFGKAPPEQLSDRQQAEKLQREIMGEVEAARAEQLLEQKRAEEAARIERERPPSVDQLVDIARGENGYGALEQVKQTLLSRKVTPEIQQSLDVIKELQDRMGLEDARRRALAEPIVMDDKTIRSLGFVPGGEKSVYAQLLNRSIGDPEVVKFLTDYASASAKPQTKQRISNFLAVNQARMIPLTAEEIAGKQPTGEIVVGGKKEEKQKEEKPEVLPSSSQLVDIASGANGYGALEQLKQRLLEKKITPEIKQSIDAIKELQEQMRLEDAKRRALAAPTVMDDKTIRSLGFVPGGEKSVYAQLFNRSVAAPEVVKFLTDYANNRANPKTKKRIENFLAANKERVAPLTAEEIAGTQPTGEIAAAKPKEQKVKGAIMGSAFLRDVNNALRGLNPSLLPEFSFKIETNRLDKRGRKIIQWRNPLTPKGPLFRAGGESDYIEIARALEEYGYLTPGTVERDPKEAGEQAKDLIKAALSRDEPLTLDEQVEQQRLFQEQRDKEDQEKLDALRGEDNYNSLDDESAIEAENERLAIIEEAGLSASDVNNLSDDDIPFDFTPGGSQDEQRGVSGEAAKAAAQEGAPSAEAGKAETKPVSEPPFTLAEAKKPKPVKLSKETEAKIAELGKILERIMSKMGLKDVALNIVQDLRANGEYANRLIKLALDADSPVRDLRHESLHAMKELGFFSDAQWATLEKMARDKWIDKYLKSRTATVDGQEMSRYDAYMELYGGNEDRVIEEAIADAFGDFDITKPPPGLMQAILRRMRNMFRAIKEAMGLANIDNAEDIFRRVEKGELKETVPMPQRAAMASLREGAEQTSVGILEGRISPDLGRNVTVDKVGAYFDSLIKQQFNGPLNYNDKAAMDRAIKIASDEVANQIRQSKSGLDWYEADIKKAFKQTIEIVPELKSQQKRTLFSVIAGIMSPQTIARDNWFIAAKAFEHYIKTGTIPGTNPENGNLWMGGTQSANKKTQLDFLDAMVKAMGEKKAVKWLMEDHTVKEINQFRKQYGGIVSGIEGKLTDARLGLYAFGPKIGPFVSNLNGIHDVTVDKWMTRTFNRYFGTMVDPDGKIIDAPTEPQRRAVKALVNEVAKNANIKPYQVQSVLWFFEQRLFTKLGAQSPSYGFSDGSKRFQEYARDRSGKEGVPAADGANRTRGANEPKLSLRGPKVATWFSGARTLEAALGDINTVMAVEYDKRINEFANSAFGTAFIARDVADIDVQEIKEADPLLFHASPVCKNFSAAKTFQGADDSDRKSAEAVSKVILEVAPPVVTIENVPKYASTGLFQNIVKALDDRGYTWDVVIHDAADYGAAQTRNRMLLRAVKDRDLPPLPEKVGPSDWYKQIEDLLIDAPASALPPVERKRLDAMIEKGQLDPSRPIITMGGSGFKGVWAAANDGGPSPTLKAANEKARVLLPDGETKTVTPRMMARLMGLPDSYPVPSSPTLAKTVLGNGIHGNVTKSLIAPLLMQESKLSLRAPQTEAFKRWFGDSKVVDENGEPLVVYHATTGNFTTFKPGGNDPTLSGPAMWFTDSKESQPAMHNIALRGKRYREGANVMPVYLRMERPLVIDDKTSLDWARAVFADGSLEFPQLIAPKWVEDVTRGDEYDGIIFDGPALGWKDSVREYIVFRPEQIKSATGNVGTFDPTNPDIRYSLRDKLGMYSELENKIEAGSNKAPAASWKAYINGLTQKGVKPEEIEWSGVKDWLDLQKGMVTKEELLNYLKQGGVRVEETVLGKQAVMEELRNASLQTLRERYANLHFMGADDPEVMAMSRDEMIGELEPDFNAEDVSLPQYSYYTLPGGENYREVLLTLPSESRGKHELAKQTWIKFQEQMREKYNGSFAWRRKATKEEKAEADRLVAELDKAAYGIVDFKSGHWDQSNIIAHIRLNDRTDADGNKVLFVEEIQSDWGQEGKKKGFALPPKEDAELDGLLKIPSWERTPSQIQRVEELNGKRLRGVPFAPFVTKTEGWLNLALKRIMVMAAEGGYDKVAFVNGKQSAKRYDLSKQVDDLRYGDGILVALKDGKIVLSKETTPEELPDLVGKEVADRLLKAPEMEGNGYRRLSGLDLKVGGEGMKTFYDTIVPIAVKKLLPKVDGGQMEMVDVQVPPASAMYPDKTTLRETIQQSGFDVTPAMRNKVQTTGLPRFSLRDRSSGAERFEPAEIEKLRTPSWKSREKLIEMPIRDFLALSDKGFDSRKMTDASLRLARGERFSSLPQLLVDFDNRVDGHEGRHRARALAEQGYTTMPVILRMAGIRWSEQSDPERFDYQKEWPKTLQAQSNADNPNLKLPFPVSRENAAAPYNADAPIVSQKQPRLSLREGPRMNLRDQTDPAVRARVEQTTTARNEKTFKQRIMDAISPTARSAFRAQAINRYNYLGVAAKKRIAKMGGAELLADADAEAAALMSDLGAGVAATALGVHDRKGGAPVYKHYFIIESNGQPLAKKYASRALAEADAKLINGVVKERGFTTVDSFNNTVKGPAPIFAPLAKYNDPYIYQLYSFYAGVKRGSRLMYVFDPKTKTVKEKLFEPADIAKAKKLEIQYPEFKTIQKEWTDYNDKLVDYMVATGVISAQNGKEFKAHGDYFPFYRQIDGDPDAVGPKIFQSIAAVKPPKKIKGSEAPLGDFLENIVRNTQSAIQAGMKNVAARRAAEIGMDVGLVDEVKIGVTPDPVNSFYVLENGLKKHYETRDILFINAVKSLNLPEFPLIGLLSGPANLLRALVTKDPGFILANLMRDSMSAWVTSGVKMVPLADTMKNFAGALAQNSGAYDALLNGGVLGGYEFSQNVETSARKFGAELRKRAGVATIGEKAVRPITGIWDALERASSASDAATRMEVYTKTLAETGNEAEALFRGLEVMNFNRKGSSAVIRILTAAIPFLNARIQGLDILYRAAIAPSLDASPSERAQQIQKTFFLRGLMIAGLSSMYWALTHDDKEYKKQEQETRDNYWLLPSLGIKIPIPFEIGVLFKVIPERIMAYMFGNDTGKDFMDSMKRQLISTFSVSPPQTFKPLIETTTNFNFFTWRAIIPPGLENVAPQYQVGPSTSKAAESIGKAIGASPMIVDHLISGYTGTMGTYMVDLMDSIFNTMTDSPKPAKRFEQMPVIRRFLVDPEARGTVSQYYDLRNSVDEAVRTVNLLEKSMNYKDYGEYVQENMKLLGARDYVLNMDKSLAELRAMKATIRLAKMSAEEKTKSITQINQMENQMTENIQALKKMFQ